MRALSALFATLALLPQSMARAAAAKTAKPKPAPALADDDGPDECPAEEVLERCGLTTRRKVLASLDAKDHAKVRALDVGVGAGMGGLFLPNPALQLNLNLSGWVGFGYEYGAYRLTLPEFGVKQKQTGWDLRVFPFHGAFFVGLGMGVRELTLTSLTALDAEINDQTTNTNNQVHEEIAWTSRIKQRVTIPKIGWQVMYPSGATWIFGAGLLLPEQKDADVTDEHDALQITSPEDVESTRQSKKDELEAIANTKLPMIEVRFAWFFDLWPSL